MKENVILNTLYICLISWDFNFVKKHLIVFGNLIIFLRGGG